MAYKQPYKQVNKNNDGAPVAFLAIRNVNKDKTR